MTPRQYYQQQLESNTIQPDPQQQVIVDILESLYDQLLADDKKSFWLNRLLHPRLSTDHQQGLYLWGSVGIGKTFLIDILYVCLPIKKLRLHFYAFMQRVHDELKKQQGHKDPLNAIAKELAEESKALFLDEFLVTNIVDAVILARLLQALFEHGVYLITTSNQPPGNLYLNGIQREQFLPAIQLIKDKTIVYHIESKKDYRLHHLEQAGVYFSPLGEVAEHQMEDLFQQLTHHEEPYEEPLVDQFIELFNRSIRVKKRTKELIWFDFLDICGPPRSQKDFLALSEQYKTIFISNIPVIERDQDKLAASFIHLVDIFYDNQVQLIVSAETDVLHLYPEGQFDDSFARIESRLIEMQSKEYLEKTLRRTLGEHYFE
jgi:cell division protein ZapE